jgi:hypothetical protein
MGQQGRPILLASRNLTTAEALPFGTHGTRGIAHEEAIGSSGRRRAACQLRRRIGPETDAPAVRQVERTHGPPEYNA